jgi:hypothetical protein
MNELDWANSQDPDAMLSYVLNTTTERKLRLCACACSGRVWPPPGTPPRFAGAWDTERARGNEWPHDEAEGKFCWPQGDPVPIRRAVDTAERFADGRASGANLRAYFDACSALADQAQGIAGSANYTLGDHYGLIELVNARQTAAAYLAAMFTCAPSMAQALPQHRNDLGVVLFRPLGQPVEAVRQAVRAAGLATFNPGGQYYPDTAAYDDACERARRDELLAQTAVLRDIWGNPFRPAAFDPSWRTSTAVAVAEPIDAERAFDRLPILADALQDAGCDDEQLLGHCRGPGPHVRGCWVVDLVLGRE